MPLQRTETYTTTGTKGSWNCDPSIAPFNVGVACELLAGATASYKLQYSYDSLDDPTLTDDDATWIDSTVIPAATSTTKEQAFTSPIARVRLVIAAVTGAGIKMTMLQGMSIN